MESRSSRGEEVTQRVMTADDISDWHQTKSSNPFKRYRINITIIVITILTTLRTQKIIITITTLLIKFTLITHLNNP